ncbi:coiled-coil domain-containing protein 25 isoform X2 [Oratosquilla oratoria]|uniref:coiled-coil domain-containing protein 25 isoform X2 n=1 Tax=Oratosquilla oratoria TaxID=337810 RepID=UPI003F77205E
MVFNFTSRVVEPPVRLFMGEDKHENEELIKWGWPEDVWFHVDKVSSAHVYIRLSLGQTIHDISQAVLEDAAQLCKANSIQVYKIRLEKRVNEIVNRLNKTKQEAHPDFRAEREERDRQERNEAKRELKEKQQKEKEELERRKKEEEQRSYNNLFCSENMKTNRQAADEDSDDFM